MTDVTARAAVAAPRSAIIQATQLRSDDNSITVETIAEPLREAFTIPPGERHPR